MERPNPQPLAVSPREAAQMLSCGVTRLYELLNAGELVSYWDGRNRKILVASIKARVDRLVAEAKAKAA